MSNPLPQRLVEFHGDELIAVQQPDGAIFILLAKVCENLGLARWPTPPAWAAQPGDRRTTVLAA